MFMFSIDVSGRSTFGIIPTLLELVNGDYVHTTQIRSGKYYIEICVEFPKAM